MGTALERKKPIVLNTREVDRRVVIEPENEDRFMMSVQEAAEACRAASEGKEWQEQFDAMLHRLAEWLYARRDAVDVGFVTMRDQRLLFVVRQKGRTFDAALEDALTDVDLEIARSPAYALLRLDVQAVPQVSEEGLRAFVGEDALVWVINRAD